MKIFDIALWRAWGGKGGVREESAQHLPCLNPFAHRGFRPTTGGGEVFSWLLASCRLAACFLQTACLLLDCSVLTAHWQREYCSSTEFLPELFENFTFISYLCKRIAHWHGVTFNWYRDRNKLHITYEPKRSNKDIWRKESPHIVGRWTGEMVFLYSRCLCRSNR